MNTQITKALKWAGMSCVMGLAALALGTGSAWAQAPTDNPYRTRYNPASEHWTDSLNWTNVVDVTSVSGLVTSGNVDSTVIHNTLRTLSSNGGGVLFFPAGTYNFSSNLILPSNVVLRGANPAVADAHDTTYAPPSRLIFPQYIPTLTGNGTPNNTAFRHIEGEENANRIAIVNLDINRAGINFHPHAYQLNTTFNTQWPVDINHSVLVYGVRSNNVAIPDPATPSTYQLNNGGAWQRWVWRFTANVDLYVARNGVVANCRLNDAPTDSYNQPGFVVQTCGTNPPADGSGSAFNVTDHYGISVNRAKIHKNNTTNANGNPYGIYGFITYANPNNEPQLFAPGNEVLDNWIFKTMRIGVTAAGNGLVIKNNKVRDIPGKEAYYGVNGNNCIANNSATLENRGMDFSGWNVTVEGNSLEVYRHVIRLGNYPSVDGEGILVQECCGGTVVRDYHIKHNTLVNRPTSSGYIGIYKMRDIFNLTIDSNNLGCKNIWVAANVNNNPNFGAYNVSIRNNVNVGAFTLDNNTGSGFTIENNVACGNVTYNFPCYVTANNNTGFNSGNCTGNQPTVLPEAMWLDPMRDTTIIIQAGVPGTLPLLYDAPTADSVSLWQGTTRVQPYVATGTSLAWDYAGTPGVFFLALRAKSSTATVENWSRTIRVTLTTLTSLASKLDASVWSVYPNPARTQLNVSLQAENLSGTSDITVLNPLGQVVKHQTVEGGVNQAQLSLQGLSRGMYLVRLQNQGRSVTTRLVVE